MKKIRLLALLLALLMIPFSVLFACQKEDVDNDEDEEENENEEENEIIPVDPTVVIDKKVDDGTKSGFLAFFNFDKADNGNLGVITPPANTSDPNYYTYADAKPIYPYYNYFNGTITNGGAYTVKSLNSSNKYLSIQRVGGIAENVSLSFDVYESYLDDAKHIVQFDVDFTRGLFEADAIVYGVKGSANQPLITITNDAIYDCNGVAIYGEKTEDARGWINIAIVVSDGERIYDVYIDSGDGYVKQTSAVEYSLDKNAYPSWHQEHTEYYRFAISTVQSGDAYFRIDNFGIRAGSEINLGELAGVDVSNVNRGTVSSQYGLVIPTIDGLKSYLESQTHLISKLKTEIFGTGALLSDRITITKLNLKSKIKDYAELRSLLEEATFNKVTTSAGTDLSKIVIDFADGTAVATAASNGSLANATVTVQNNVILFDWIDYRTNMPAAAKFADSVLTTYSDKNCTRVAATYKVEYEFDSSTEDIFHDYGALLGYYDEVSVFTNANGATLTVITYNGKLTYKADADSEAVNGTYTVAENGIITIALGDGTLVYAKYADGTLTVYSDEAATENADAYTIAPATGKDFTLGENEMLGIKFVNFGDISNNIDSGDGNYQTGSSYFEMWDNNWYTTNKSNLSTLKLSMYISEEMVNANIEFMLMLCQPFYFDEAQNKNVGPYMYFVFKLADDTHKPGVDGNTIYYTEGLNEWELDLTKMASAYGCTIDKATRMCFRYHGWSNNAAGKTNAPFYITKFEFTLSNILVEVTAPDHDKADCPHEDDLGDSTWVSNPTPVLGDCHVGSYYIKTCSICNATEVDTSKPTGYIGGKHSYGDVVTIPATCVSDGRSYRECSICGDVQTISKENMLDHELIVISIVGKEVTQVCKTCGRASSFTIRTEMISYTQKILDLGIAEGDKQTWSVNSLSNLNIVGSSGGRINNFTSVVIKNANTTTMSSVDTKHGTMLLIEGGKLAGETYIDIVPGPINTSTFFKGQNFTYEFDYMKGEPGTNGQYVNMSAGLGWRNGAITYTNWGMLNFTTSGGLRLSEYGTAGRGSYGNTKEFETEKGVLYNVAVHLNLKTNKISLYINGVKWDECQFLASVEDSMIFGVTHIRFWCGGVPTGSQTYLNNYIHYASETEPFCVLTPGFEGGTDVVGEIKLLDELRNPMKSDFEVRNPGHNAEFFLPTAVSSGLGKQKYTLEFTVSADEFADGTLLVGNKMGNGYARSADLVSVRDGKIYVYGVLVCDVSESVKLALAFDDNTGTMIVYVNGNRVSGTIELSGDYAMTDGVISGFAFLNECGSYSVSGLKMYTGNDVQ